MAGSPPAAGKAVTLANWQNTPFNRWGFLHVSELMPTATISRGAGPATELTVAPRDLDRLILDVGGGEVAFAEILDSTYTDSIVVIHRGELAFERYAPGVEPHRRHLLMSVSKSLTATLAGVLVGRGDLDTSALVPDIARALRGSSFEGCTVQHLLDMRAGTRFDETDYDDFDSDGRKIEEVSGYRTRSHAGLPPDLYAYILSMENDAEHGGVFRYRSILTDVLAWVIAEASGDSFVRLFERDIWSRIGAEHDVDLMVDASGFPVAEAGFCITARDLARFGLMHLERGEVDGTRIVPARWIDRVCTPDAELAGAFAGSSETGEMGTYSMYHDCWWVIDAERGIYSGLGLNGQQLLIHRPSRTAIAKFSTWPRGFIQDLDDLQTSALLGVCEALDRGEI
jgi:CubicO group peptidase (beta-lactamase class C family)